MLDDMESLEEAVGGSTELASVLVRAEATETRTLLNVRDLADAFADEQSRPRAAAGPMAPTYESLVRDWTHDSGEPGDKYDPELAALFREASAGVQLDRVLMAEFLTQLGEKEPALATVLVDNPDDTDAILLQFPIYSDDSEAATLIQEEIEALWSGDDGSITAMSAGISSVTVTDQITARQTEAITTTVAAALGILTLFFWVTVRRPVLGFVAVGPVVLVLIWVLGTMALLGIPYTVITSIITALSIGIGVDYTIHMIHRYQEEFSRVRNPEKAAVRTLATTGSALLGSALTTALGVRCFGVLAGARVLAVRHHSCDHDWVFAARVDLGRTAGDDRLGAPMRTCVCAQRCRACGTTSTWRSTMCTSVTKNRARQTGSSCRFSATTNFNFLFGRCDGNG